MSQLIWELVKHNNAFLVKRGGASFTSDPFSLTGSNTPIGLGFTGLNGMALQAGEKQAIITSLRKGQSHKVVRKEGTLLAETLKVKGGVQRVAKIVDARFQTEGLKQLAQKKLVNFHKSNVRAQENVKAEAKAAKKN